MLVLTRKIGERIVIGEAITITVVDVKGDNVRISIEAPKEVRILRGELLDATAAENKEAIVSKKARELGFLKDIKKTGEQ